MGNTLSETHISIAHRTIAQSYAATSQPINDLLEQATKGRNEGWLLVGAVAHCMAEQLAW